MSMNSVRTESLRTRVSPESPRRLSLPDTGPP
jgi:hypothetical protein